VKSGPFKGERLDHDIWNQMLDRIYALHGWDIETSWQTREGLEQIGLSEVAEKLERIGRLR
jgi:aldehyde:ferredoxin oxidoreductase